MDGSAHQGLTHQHPWDLNLVVFLVVVVVVTQSSLTATTWTVAQWAPLDSADKNTGVDCHFLLQSSRLQLGKPLQSSEEDF